MGKKYSVKPVIVDFGQINLAQLLNILAKEGKIRIRGLGDFSLKPIAGRTGWNPVKRVSMEIPAYNKICFKPDPRFKKFFN